MYKPLFTFFIGLLMNHLTYSINPLLTYMVRFNKITLYPNITADYTINRYRDLQSVSGNFTLPTQKELVDSVLVVIQRCNPEGFDCEYYTTWKMTDICTKIVQKNQFWSSWYSSFHPPMVCPLDKVHYKLINGTVEIGPLLVLNPQIPDYQWKVTQKLYAGDLYIGAYMMDVSIFGYRKRTKSILNN